MTVFLHELRLGKRFLMIWSAAISFMLGVCILIYPEMSSQMTEISDMFADMGSFSSAFGMDEINFGEFMGYFSVECGNVLGLGGAIFSALIAASSLAGEEKSGSSEFLFTHPVSRHSIVLQKLLSVFAEIFILNLLAAAVSAVCMLIISADANAAQIALIFFAYFMMQLQIAAIAFCVSSFTASGGVGIGLGIAFGAYLLNILANLEDNLTLLKYLTPFGYTDGAYIHRHTALQTGYLFSGLAILSAAVLLSFYQYKKKDL